MTDSIFYKFVKYLNQLFKYEFTMSVFFIFTVEIVIFALYNFTIDFNHTADNYVFSLSVFFSIIYLIAILFLIIHLLIKSSEEKYFYGVSKKYFFVSRGLVKKFPQNKFLPISLLYFYIYSVIMVAAYSNAIAQTLLTTFLCLGMVLYLIFSSPPKKAYYKGLMILVFALLLVVHILYLILAVADEHNNINSKTRWIIGFVIGIMLGVMFILITLSILLGFFIEILLMCYYKSLNK